MNINRDNYEAYLLDYFENKLSTRQLAELMVFLESNPDLNVDLEGFEMLSLEPDQTVVFHEKDGLKKNEITPYAFLTEKNYEEYFVASAEGELSIEEEKDLEIFIGLNPELKREYDLFHLTVLQPDTSIHYPAKQSLKKSAFGTTFFVNRQMIYSAVAVAASIALLISIYIDFRPISPSTQLAQINGNTSPSVLIPHSGFSVPRLLSQPAEPEPAQQLHVVPALQYTTTQLAFSKPDIHDIEPIAALSDAVLITSDSDDDRLFSTGRTKYTELYGYIQLREQREYEEYLASLDERSWYAKAFSGLKTVVFGPEEYDPTGVKRDNDLWLLAETGIKGINYITKSDFRLKRELDEDGRTAAYAVANNRIEYSGKVGK